MAFVPTFSYDFVRGEMYCSRGQQLHLIHPTSLIQLVRDELAVMKFAITSMAIGKGEIMVNITDNAILSSKLVSFSKTIGNTVD